MFEFVRKHTRIMQFVLLLLIFPAFVFFGIEGYSSFSAGSTSVAKVAGQSITQAEWDGAHRVYAERLRTKQPNIDAALLDSPAAKQESLEELVRERVLLIAAEKLHLEATDARLKRMFASDPQFAFLRTPDGALNKEILISRGLSPQQFEIKLRQDASMRQVLEGVSASAVGTAKAAGVALDALLQQREVRVVRFEAKNYVDKVQPTDAEVEAYYKDPKLGAAFELPERIAIEYVVLDVEALKAGSTVSEDEMRQFYDQNASRFGTPEERRASHILVKADAGANAAERGKARAKAEALLADLKKDPSRFAELAKANSDDPGSAAKGGDLDFFGRGAMVKSFEEAAFALKAGELSGIVESEFGFHIIQLTAVRGGERKTFEAARADIEAEIKQQMAQRKFAEAAEAFTNTVYEQSDSLQPVADKLQLPIKTAKALTRTPEQGAQGPLANAKFLGALFSNEVLRDKRNTEAIEIGANQLAAARVTEHAPARKLPLEEVKEAVRLKVVAQQAGQLARKDAEGKLAQWRAGAAPADGTLEEPMRVSRTAGQIYPAELIDAVMKAPPSPLPSWAGVDFGEQGYAVVRIDKLLPRDSAAGDAAQLQGQYGQAWGAAEADAYYQALRERYKVKVTGVAKPAESTTP